MKWLIDSMMDFFADLFFGRSRIESKYTRYVKVVKDQASTSSMLKEAKKFYSEQKKVCEDEKKRYENRLNNVNTMLEWAESRYEEVLKKEGD